MTYDKIAFPIIILIIPWDKQYYFHLPIEETGECSSSDLGHDSNCKDYAPAYTLRWRNTVPCTHVRAGCQEVCRCGIGCKQRPRSPVWPHNHLWNKTPAGLGHEGGPYTLLTSYLAISFLCFKNTLIVRQCTQKRWSPLVDNLVKIIYGLSCY